MIQTILRFIVIGLKTFEAQSKTSAYFQTETVTHFYESALGSGSPLGNLASCFQDSDQIFMRVTLHIDNKTQGIFNYCQYSLQALISKLAGVSSTQIRD